MLSKPSFTISLIPHRLIYLEQPSYNNSDLKRLEKGQSLDPKMVEVAESNLDKRCTELIKSNPEIMKTLHENLNFKDEELSIRMPSNGKTSDLNPGYERLTATEKKTLDEKQSRFAHFEIKIGKNAPIPLNAAVPGAEFNLFALFQKGLNNWINQQKQKPQLEADRKKLFEATTINGANDFFAKKPWLLQTLKNMYPGLKKVVIKKPAVETKTDAEQKKIGYHIVTEMVLLDGSDQEIKNYRFIKVKNEAANKADTSMTEEDYLNLINGFLEANRNVQDQATKRTLEGRRQYYEKAPRNEENKEMLRTLPAPDKSRAELYEKFASILSPIAEKAFQNMPMENLTQLWNYLYTATELDGKKLEKIRVKQSILGFSQVSFGLKFKGEPEKPLRIPM